MIKQGMMLVLAGAVLLGCGQAPKEEAIERQDFSGDAHILRSALADLYPSGDRYGQGQALAAALDRLDEATAQPLDPMVFYRAVADVAVAAKDEHIIPFPPSDYRDHRRAGQMMLPYTVRWVAGEPYVAAVADPAFIDSIGSRVLAFDGTEAADVRDALLATIPADGLSETFAYRHLQDFTPTQNENYFDLNYPIWFGEKQRYSLTLADGDGAAWTVAMDALDWTSFSSFYRQRLPRNPPVAFRWLEPDIAYLSLLSFHDWYYEEHGIDPAARLAEIFAELADRPGAALILDLRRNEGGGDISSLLLDYLMPAAFTEYDQVLTSFVGQPTSAQYCANAAEVAFDPAWSEPAEDGLFKLRPEFGSLITGASERAPMPGAFGGKLVVLISGSTGSAAAKVSAVLDREHRALFIGEETGGAAAGATAFGYCTLMLPDSGIRVDIPLVRFEREMDIPYGRGVMPDIALDAGLYPPLSSEDEALVTAIQWQSDNRPEAVSD